MTPYCGARTRSGGACRREAGWGTEHVGFGRCKLHGGTAPSGNTAGIRAEALAYAAEHYGMRDIQPTDALLMCVRDAAGQLAFYKQAIAGLEPEELLRDGRPHPWVVLRMEAADRCATYSSKALTAGVAERAVQLAERMGEVLATAAERMLAALPELSDKDRARAVKVFGQAIAELEAGDPIEGTVAE